MSTSTTCRDLKSALIHEYDIVVLISLVDGHKCNGDCGGFCALMSAAIRKEYMKRGKEESVKLTPVSGPPLPFRELTEANLAWFREDAKIFNAEENNDSTREAQTKILG